MCLKLWSLSAIKPFGEERESSKKTENKVCVSVVGPLDPLYEEFPMLIVESYDNITVEYLDEKYDALRKRLGTFGVHSKFVRGYSDFHPPPGIISGKRVSICD